MLTDYIDAALPRATDNILEDGASWGETLALHGLWRSGPTREACRDEPGEVTEEWLVFTFKWDRSIPVINGIDLNVTATV